MFTLLTVIFIATVVVEMGWKTRLFARLFHHRS